MIRDYVHETLDEEVEAIGGYYLFNKEVRLPFKHREVLYLVGFAIVDRSCCGPGGCGFALVPGYVVSWKSRIDDNGKPVSQVKPIQEKSIQQALTRLIQQSEVVTQVQFL
ncbi:MAG: hypothetical protein PVG99_06380 [Desulfobacteraceae bacterium]|jgi:hypothetical protein